MTVWLIFSIFGGRGWIVPLTSLAVRARYSSSKKYCFKRVKCDSGEQAEGNALATQTASICASRRSWLCKNFAALCEETADRVTSHMPCLHVDTGGGLWVTLKEVSPCKRSIVDCQNPKNKTQIALCSGGSDIKASRYDKMSVASPRLRFFPFKTKALTTLKNDTFCVEDLSV